MLTDTSAPLAEPDNDGIVTLSDALSWQSLSPDSLLAGWLSGRNMGLVADRLQRSGALNVIATSVPGIQDVLMLGHLRRLVDEGNYDRIIVDGPASGRARELLRAPLMVASVSSEGPIFDQATRANEMLCNPASSAVLLVTIAEETPINETIETAFDIEDDPGIRLAGVVVNRLFPMVEPPKSFNTHPLGLTVQSRFAFNSEQRQRLLDELPVPHVDIAENPVGVTSPQHIDELLSGTFEPATNDGSEVTVPPFDGAALDAALSRSIIVTVGTGGVGKTTLGAALAVRAAAMGRSVALITIDPAKRLADALGLEKLDDDLREVDIAGAGSGKLLATMLDPGATFERVVRAEATSDEHADQILASPLAEQLTDSLSGMTEYMAVERLWQLHSDPDIDLVVVDTPPSSDALAFLDAPNLLARLLDNRIYKMLVHDKRGGLINRALGGVVTQLVATVGGTVVQEAVEFFKNFEGIEDDFRARGDLIYKALRSNATDFIVVAIPTGASLSNAHDFTEQLRDSGVEPSLTIINRSTPPVPKAGRSKAASAIVDHLWTKRTAERQNIAAFANRSSTPIVLVDDLPEPVANIEGIQTLAQNL